MTPVGVQLSLFLQAFDQAVSDVCAFANCSREMFFLAGQRWIDNLNARQGPIDAQSYYVEATGDDQLGWIASQVWLQFSAPTLWLALERISGAENVDCLDFGCGTGAVPFALRDRFRRVLFCDVANAAQAFIDWRRQRYDARNVATLTPDRLDGIGPVQLLLLMDVLEHLPDSSEVFARATALLEPGGLLLFNAPWHSRAPIAEHLATAEADWYKAGGGAALLADQFHQIEAWEHGGVYQRLSA